MIRNTKQNWTVGQNVKVGFLILKVRAAIATPGDYLPDSYILSNLDGTQLYNFIPHNGLSKITTDEAKEMINQNEEYALAQIASALVKSAQKSAIDKVFA